MGQPRRSLLQKLTQRLLLSRRSFALLQHLGVHVTRNHFYNPVPDTHALDQDTAFWEDEDELSGISINIKGQLETLEKVFTRYSSECDFPLSRGPEPHGYYINNGAFGLISAGVLHCMIRHYGPRLIIEVGSGNSTYVSARAIRMNQSGANETTLVSIEPYPNEVLRRGFPGLSRLIQEKVEDVGLEFFKQLEAGDILFIDSSHVVRTGGDVNFLFLKLLPQLKPGVVVHVHDIFFPKQYPKDWIIKNHWFWSEQYLLQAFLAFNSAFEVLWCGSLMYLKHLNSLKSVFPPPPGLDINEKNYFSSSFWMRKVS